MIKVINLLAVVAMTTLSACSSITQNEVEVAQESMNGKKMTFRCNATSINPSNCYKDALKACPSGFNIIKQTDYKSTRHPHSNGINKTALVVNCNDRSISKLK
jgi:hypothetical protein